MVMARLHVICGNCGALATNDNPGYLKHEINEGDEDTPAWVSISCGNCATLHTLEDTLPVRKR